MHAFLLAWPWLARRDGNGVAQLGLGGPQGVGNGRFSCPGRSGNHKTDSAPFQPRPCFRRSALHHTAFQLPYCSPASKRLGKHGLGRHACPLCPVACSPSNSLALRERP
ncbi:hypothetical protein AtDm6_0750 [Acetobacter tropicalis]|uniref:Uncharacterized protein n=1 Tax=Acetobacter tropicalis TaxID=104102 RepID=A0A094YU58_9PROT|nr:hypothetical protein AtDm6_0750 [Acetobacter tropicalis]